MGEQYVEKAQPLRYFIDGIEVTEDEAVAAEQEGRAKVSRGGSGVVPVEFRKPGETEDEWLRPWLAMRSVNSNPPGDDNGPAVVKQCGICTALGHTSDEHAASNNSLPPDEAGP